LDGETGITFEDVQDLSQWVDVAIIEDCPDNCPAMLKLKRHASHELDSYPTILYNEGAGCQVHKLHKYIVAPLGEDKIVGHCHAVQFVLGITARRNALLSALFKLVDYEYQKHDGPPPASYGPQWDALLDMTLIRIQKLIWARSGVDSGYDPEEFSVACRIRMTAFRAMVNCNPQSRTCAHFETGCCQGLDGTFSRNVGVRNFFTALVMVGIFGGVYSGTPSISRWMSSSQLLCFISAGWSIFAILPRAFALAFSTWEVPRSMQDTDDFHFVVRSKVYRSKLFLLNAAAQDTGLIFCWVATPAEHCMQVIQRRDHQGGILRDMCDPSKNHYSICIRQYSLMVSDPMSTNIATLVRLKEHEGPPAITTQQ